MFETKLDNVSYLGGDLNVLSKGLPNGQSWREGVANDAKLAKYISTFKNSLQKNIDPDALRRSAEEEFNIIREFVTLAEQLTVNHEPSETYESNKQHAIYAAATWVEYAVLYKAQQLSTNIPAARA